MCRDMLNAIVGYTDNVECCWLEQNQAVNFSLNNVKISTNVIQCRLTAEVDLQKISDL